MNLSDEELMLLEQLTYIDTNLCNAVGMDKKQFEKITKAESVSEIVEQFDGHLDELSQMGDIPDYVYYQGNELVAIINEIKNDPKLMDLNIKEIIPHTSKNSTNTVIDKMVFYEGDSNKLPDDAIVCFKGTLDGEEWKDNFLLLYEADTPVNKDALKYVDSLPFENITVVGHSKGANKAAYCYYESDKVVGCVAMDCPGFADSYYKDNQEKVDKAIKQGNIRSYAIEGDYVNIMMTELYGTHTRYCQGYGMNSFFENHCPGSFFQVGLDGTLQRNNHGELISYSTQNETMEKAHKFTLFVQKYMPEDTKEKEAEYLGNIAALFLSNTTEVVANGVVYKKDDEKNNAIAYMLSDKDKLSTFLAYFLVYANKYGLKGKDIESFIPSDKSFWFKRLVPVLFDLLRNNFKDGEVDGAFIKAINWAVKKYGGDDFLEYTTIEELDKLIYETQEKYNSIADVVGRGTNLYDDHMPQLFFWGQPFTTPSESNENYLKPFQIPRSVIPESEPLYSIPGMTVPATEPQIPIVLFGEDSNNASEAASNNITIGKGGAPRSGKAAGNAMSNSMFATVDKDTMYVDVAEFERHRKDIYNAADKLIFNAKPAFEREAGICGTESVCLMTDYWHKVIDTTDRFREFKMGPADLLMRNTLKSLLDVDAESAETIKVQSGNG